MSWSYSGDPSTSNRDAVRFYLQDTDEENQTMSDEDIDFLLKSETKPLDAAILGLKTLVTKYSMLSETTIGDTMVRYTQKISDITKLISLLENTSATENIQPAVAVNNAQMNYQGPKMLFYKGIFGRG